MAIYDGTYRWDGTKKNGQDPIAWSPGAYNLKIYKRDVSGEKVKLLKPYVCVYSRTGVGHSISANPEKFVKQLCKEFSLDIDRVLWIEDHLLDENRYEVIMFTKSAQLGPSVFYKIVKRNASQHEVAQLEQDTTG